MLPSGSKLHLSCARYRTRSCLLLAADLLRIFQETLRCRPPCFGIFAKTRWLGINFYFSLKKKNKATQIHFIYRLTDETTNKEKKEEEKKKYYRL